MATDNRFHKYLAAESDFRQAAAAALLIGYDSDMLSQIVCVEHQHLEEEREEERIAHCDWFRNLNFVAYVAEHPGLSQGELTEELGMAPCHITKRVKKLANKLRRIGRGTKNDPYRYFAQEKDAC